ncbi:MAG: RadC family protein [Bacteroidia bacterium]
MENKQPIHVWAEDDRPREKLMLKGRAALSDAELIAILIGHGTRRYSAVDVGRKLLASAGNDLQRLSRMSISEMCKIEGIGKAVSIAAAIELGMRKKASGISEVRISNSQTAYQRLLPVFEDLVYEQFWILTLSNSNQVIAAHRVGEGGLTGTVADPRRIFKQVLDDRAAGFIAAHNHPSGNLKPSDADIRLTKRLRESAAIMDVSMLDHLIIAHTGYFSFADEGLLGAD